MIDALPVNGSDPERVAVTAPVPTLVAVKMPSAVIVPSDEGETDHVTRGIEAILPLSCCAAVKR